MVTNSPAKAGNMGSIPGWGRSSEEEMATHSSILDWEIPWTEEPGRLQPIVSQRVERDCTQMHARKLALRNAKKLGLYLSALVMNRRLRITDLCRHCSATFSGVSLSLWRFLQKLSRKTRTSNLRQISFFLVLTGLNYPATPLTI